MDHQDWTPVVLRNTNTKTNIKKLPHNKLPKYKEDEDGKQIKKVLPKDFGNKMQVFRASKGWSQKELANKLSVKVSEIQNYEQNKVENPNRGFARRIEKILEADLF